MSKIIKTIYKGKEHQYLLLNKVKDNCPICDTPLNQVNGRWNMFHGEVAASCCKAPFQTKDYYVDPENSEGYDKYFELLNKPNNWSLSIAKEWVEPLRKAVEQTGVYDIYDKSVQELANQLKKGE